MAPTRLIPAAILTLAAGPVLADAHEAAGPDMLSYGVRPAYLIDQMEPSELRDTLQACLGQEPQQTAFSIGHRGAPLQFPEHTVESNVAAARMGAGILECDVTFTADRELVCRHAQNDLHTTTNIVATDLADTCITPFTVGEDGATAECRTSEITLAEFRTLQPTMDAANASAQTPEEYIQGGTADWRTDLFDDNATLLTHAESIALFDSLGADFTPELKSPSVEMPFEGEYTQEDYAQALIDEYIEAGIEPSRVWPQSFNLEDVLYWVNNTEYGEQAVYLMDEYDIEGYSPMDPSTWPDTMEALAERGVNYIAPPLWMLVTLNDAGEMVPSVLAEEANAAGLGIITWTLERSGPLGNGGGWYFQSVTDAIDNDGDYFEILDVLAQDVGVVGVFSDWPATTTFYANCMGL